MKGGAARERHESIWGRHKLEDATKRPRFAGPGAAPRLRVELAPPEADAQQDSRNRHDAFSAANSTNTHKAPSAPAVDKEATSKDMAEDRRIAGDSDETEAHVGKKRNRAHKSRQEANESKSSAGISTASGGESRHDAHREHKSAAPGHNHTDKAKAAESKNGGESSGQNNSKAAGKSNSAASKNATVENQETSRPSTATAASSKVASADKAPSSSKAAPAAARSATHKKLAAQHDEVLHCWWCACGCPPGSWMFGFLVTRRSPPQAACVFTCIYRYKRKRAHTQANTTHACICAST
jgi:hypothetical protein